MREIAFGIHQRLRHPFLGYGRTYTDKQISEVWNRERDCCLMHHVGRGDALLALGRVIAAVCDNSCDFIVERKCLFGWIFAIVRRVRDESGVKGAGMGDVSLYLVAVIHTPVGMEETYGGTGPDPL